MYALSKVLSKPLFILFLKGLHRLWDYQVSANAVEANVLHVLIHGAAKKTIKKYKNAGAVIIGEAVNAHPIAQKRLLESECYASGMEIEKATLDAMIDEFSLCDYLLVPSVFVYKSFVDQGFSEKNLILLPYGLDVIRDEPVVVDLPKSKISILVVGGIGCRKGQKYIVQASRELISDGIQVSLTLLGRADKLYVDKYMSDQDKFINYIDHVDNNEMCDFMRRYDVLVLPSIEDGFGIVVAEAISAGVPVVVSSNAGSADLVEDGVNGFVFTAADGGSLAAVLRECLGRRFYVAAPMGWEWEGYADDIAQISRRGCAVCVICS